MRPASLILALALAASPASASYDLAPGDHLVFRQTLEREVKSPETETATRLGWTTHVLVLSVRDAQALVASQRNLDGVELLRYSEGGRDRTKAERPAFAEEMTKRGRVFSEANRVTPDGRRLLPWAVVREGTSEVLPAIHELPPLPPAGGPGSWREPELFGLNLTAVAEGACLRISGEGGRLRVRYSVCEGALQSLELEAEYDTPVSRRVRETLRIERTERRRGEPAAGWLDDDATRDAVLSAWLVSDSPLLAAAELTARRGRDARFDRRLEAADRRFDPAAKPADPRDAALAAVVRAVFGNGSLPDWRCAEPDRAERGLRLRRAAPQVPGTTLRVMTTPPFQGRPYLLHVPESYRGDRPYPLYVLLAGGPGRAVPMAQSVRASLRDLEALVLIPDALGEMWWTENPTRAVAAAIDEVLAQANVDPNRVSLSGFSNGGTGALYYATLWPDRFAAVAPLMGAGAALFEADAPLRLANAAGIPMLFLHGDRDTVIPSHASEDTVRALRRLDAKATVALEILKGRGHDITVGTDDGRTLRFLQDKQRPGFPRRLVFQTRLGGRRDWVEVARKKGGVAEVEAAIGEDRVVRIKTRRVEDLKLLLRSELFPGEGPIAVEIDGKRRYEGPLAEDCARLLETWRRTSDPFRAWATELAFVP